MSGIEIAGLALAVLPILIEIAKQARSKEHDAKRAEIIENLCWEITYLKINLKSLAAMLIQLPKDVRYELSASTSPQTLKSAWQRKEVALALEQRLGHSHPSFCLALRSILGCLEQLVEKESLRLLDEEVVLSDRAYAKLHAITNESTTNTTFTLASRIRFAVYEGSRYDRDLKKISENNGRLEKIIFSLRDAPIAYITKPENRQLCAPHLNLRPLMHTLYTALGGLWPCNCDCRHVARVSLVKYCEDATTNDPEGEHVSFNMLMSMDGQGTGPYLRWFESQIWVMLYPRRDSPQQRPGVQFSVQPPRAPESSRVSLRAIGKSTKKNIINLLGRRPTPTTPQATVKAKPQQTHRPDPIQKPGKQYKRIDKLLCQSLMLMHSKGRLPEVLYDGTSVRHANGMSALRKQPVSSKIKQNSIDASLAMILEQRTRMNLKEKRILAVILAHSLLHFGESPWLTKEWSKEQILFSTEGGSFDVRRPYLSTEFQTAAIVHNAHDEDSVHPSASILALGILLLEIALQRSIEAQQSSDDLDEDGQPTVNTRYFTAARVLEEAADEEYESYRTVVSACLGCPFYDPETMIASLDDQGFRQAVYDHIVMPLELDLRTGFPDVTLYGPSFTSA